MASNPLLLTPTTTPVAEIAGIHERLTRTFVSGKTRDAEYRKVQLRKLFYAVKDNSMRIVAALKQDLGKPGHEALMVEVDWVEKDIVYVLEHLDRWMADDTPDTPLVFRMLKPRLRKEPIGTVLIIGCVLRGVEWSGVEWADMTKELSTTRCSSFWCPSSAPSRPVARRSSSPAR